MGVDVVKPIIDFKLWGHNLCDGPREIKMGLYTLVQSICRACDGQGRLSMSGKHVNWLVILAHGTAGAQH